MGNVFRYLDGDFDFVETELDEDEAERLEEEVDSGICAICGKHIGDWGLDMEQFLDVTDEYPLPVNVCFKCALKAFLAGRF